MQQSIFTNKQISWFNLSIAVAVIALFVPLLGYAYVGLFSRYVGDDFCNHAIIQSEGLFGAVEYWYLNWTGNFSLVFFRGLLRLIGGPELSPYLPFLFLTLWLIALMSVLLQLSIMIRLSYPVLISLVGAQLILFATLDGTPDIYQSFYWRVGMFPYTGPLIFLTIYASIVLYRIRGSQNYTTLPWWLLLSFVLTFLAGGLAESYLVVQTALLFIAGVMCTIAVTGERKRVCLYIFIAGFVGSLLAMAVSIPAPGNYVRQTLFVSPPNLLLLVKMSILYASYMVCRPVLPLLQPLITQVVPLVSPESQRWLQPALELATSPLTMGVLLLLPALLAFTKHPEIIDPIIHKKVTWLFILIPIVGFVLIISNIGPSVYAMSSPPPPRVLIIPQFVFVCTVVFWAYLAGLMLRRMYTLRNEHLSVFLIKFGSVVVVVLLILASVISTQRILTLGSTYRTWAEQWDNIDHQIRTAKDQGLSVVTVPPLADIESPVSGLMGLQSYNTNPGNWALPCIVEFYDLDEIIVE